MKKVSLEVLFDEISKVSNVFKSIAISELFYNAIQEYFVHHFYYNHDTICGLPFVVSKDLEFSDYQLLKFDITKIKNK